MASSSEQFSKYLHTILDPKVEEIYDSNTSSEGEESPYHQFYELGRNVKESMNGTSLSYKNIQEGAVLFAFTAANTFISKDNQVDGVRSTLSDFAVILSRDLSPLSERSHQGRKDTEAIKWKLSEKWQEYDLGKEKRSQLTAVLKEILLKKHDNPTK